MTAEELTTVKQTWRLLRQTNPTLLGDLFFARLQVENPALSKRYGGFSGTHYEEAIRMVSTIVARLERLDTLSSYWPVIARYFDLYGIRPLYYDSCCNALLWAIRQGLGRDWTPGVEQAWRAYCRLVCDCLADA
ncbi:globin family protein [Tellurirhabdus rosea]|uniref:hemoglobin n=1 Tax=Tellurirhabdus rosea TaxID=2674997 RepID=UPI0022513111|nr:hemoglobin [Tellurirhabdus rosea]